jgi:peptidyl-prolyl cis-trans isomerase C
MRDPHPAARLSGRATRRRVGRVGACLLRGVLVLVVGAGPVAAAEIVARVNGTPITKAMVNQVVKSLIVARGGTPSSEEIAQLSDDALESLIDLELLYAAAQKDQIRVSDEDVQAEIARNKARIGGDKAFADALRRSGMSEAQLVADTRKTLMVERFLDQRVTRDASVPPEEAQRFYDQHQQAFQHDEQVHLRELVVPVSPTAAAAERAKARQLADELHGQLRGGATFAQFAKTYATDPDAAAHDGDRGFIDRDALPTALASAAFTLPPGQLSEAIETPDGYHLIIVVERRPAGVVPFAEARPFVEETLLDSQRRERQQAYVEELRKSATIERPTPIP